VKTFHRASILALALVILGGCASTQDTVAMPQDQIVDDAAYMAQVENQALRRGVAVRWVNVPHKRINDAQQDQ
jgi:uncharacterized protein YcfL